MSLEIIPIGGFSEIGRNCAALKVDDEIVIFDMGLHMEKYIEHTDSRDLVDMSVETLMDIGAVPDIRVLKEMKEKVVAICIGHAHLDHLGAAVFLSNEFDCPVIGSPFTMAVFDAMVKDQRIDVENELIQLKVNSKYKLSKNLELEFLNATHSTPETVLMAIHSKYGTVVYANDFKLDYNPTLGQKTNIKRLKEMDIKALIVDCLYSTTPSKTPSESVAKDMLKDVLLNYDTKNKNIFVTTFSSHIARLKTIKEIGKKLGRKVVFLGRSLAKYSYAAEDANITKFDDVTIVKYSGKVKKFFLKLKNTTKYLFVVTGHQGESKAVLSKIIDEKYFNFKSGDIIVFSCGVIPVKKNVSDRKILEQKLKQKHLKIFNNIHVSGHAFLEDQRYLFGIAKPEHIIPVHGDQKRMEAMKKMALEEGWNKKNIHMLKNKEKVILS
ncbi:MAG: MBL fold metallo-hydrolase RNA specificity domain-containing protein [archaeon]